MSNPIKKTDVFEEGLFDDAIKGAEDYLIVLKGIAQEQLNILKSNPFKSTADMAAFEKAEKSKNIVLAEANRLEKEAQRLRLAEIQLNKQREKAFDNYEKQLKRTQKEKEKAFDLEKKQNSEYQKSVKQLASLKSELKELEIRGRSNGKLFKALSEEFSNLDKKVRLAEEGVGEFQRNVGNYPNAKKELKEINAQLTILAQQGKQGTEEFNNLAKKAGDLRDSINDAKDASKALASGSKFQQAGNLFGQITSDLKDLDFAGAAEKAKTFTSVIKSISFSDLKTQLVGFATTLKELGLAFLTNPFTLLLAGVTALGYGIYRLVDSFGDLNKTTETVNESIERTTKNIETLTRKQAELYVKLAVARGKYSKEEGDLKIQELQNFNERTDRAKQYAEDVQKLAKELNLSLSELEGGRFKESYTGDIEELNNKKRFNREKARLDADYKKDLKEIIKTQILEKQLIQAEADADERKKKKEENDKKLKEQKEAHKKELKELEEFRKKLRESLQKDADDRAEQAEKERKERDEQSEKDKEDSILNGADAQETETQILKNGEAARKAIREKNRKENIKQIAKESEHLIDIIDKGLQQAAERRKAAIDEEIKERETNIDRQQKLAEKGLANTLAFEEAQKERAELRKEEEKKREIKRQKSIAFVRLLAAYAESGNAGSALARATADMALASLIENAFKDGVENLDGPGTETSDSIIARLSKGESVATAKATKENPGLVTAMNDGSVDEYIEKNYLPRYMMDPGGSPSFAKNIVDSAQLNQLISMNKRLESLENTIANKREMDINWNANGDMIKSTVENGMRTVITYVHKKPRI